MLKPPVLLMTQIRVGLSGRRGNMTKFNRRTLLSAEQLLERSLKDMGKF